MKLLKQYELLYEAEQAAEELANQGILVHISSKRANSLSSYITGSLRVGLWSVLEHQYLDAESYLRNKNHKVTTGLAIEELVEFRTRAKRKSLTLLAKYISCLLVTILLILTVVYHVAVI